MKIFFMTRFDVVLLIRFRYRMPVVLGSVIEEES